MENDGHEEEQIIGFLKQAGAGVPIKQLCRKCGDDLAIGAFMICCVRSFPKSIISACIGSTALPN